MGDELSETGADVAGTAESTGQVDPWVLAGLPGELPVATYLTTRNAAVYRLLVDVLLDAQQESLTGVRHDDLPGLLRNRVAAAGAADPVHLVGEELPTLETRMRQLVAWGVVHAWQDRAVRDEDFLRNRARYQLTPLAARLHHAVRALDEDSVDDTLANLAPAVLHSQLTALVESLTNDAQRAAETCTVLASTIAQMATTAARWQATLAGALAGASTPAKVTVLQTTLNRYIDVWGSGVDVHGGPVGVTATDLLAEPVTSWRRPALATLPADAAETDVERTVNQFRGTLATIARWFAGTDSQAVRLRRQMRDAIAPLVRGRRSVASVGGNLSRRAELLELAGRLERSPDEDQAWRLWCAATGLFEARHLAHAAPDPEANPATVSWWDAAPVQLEVRLRTQGPRALTGTAARIADRAEGRRAARSEAARRRAEEARVAADLLARSGTRLSSWVGVSRGEFDVLLRLLAALSGSRPDEDGDRSATTPDGYWVVRARPAPAGAPAAVVHTTVGRLVCADLRLDLTTTGRTP